MVILLFHIFANFCIGRAEGAAVGRSQFHLNNTIEIWTGYSELHFVTASGLSEFIGTVSFIGNDVEVGGFGNGTQCIGNMATQGVLVGSEGFEFGEALVFLKVGFGPLGIIEIKLSDTIPRSGFVFPILFTRDSIPGAVVSRGRPRGSERGSKV